MEKYSLFPNAFYDFIVFVGSTTVFVVGLFIGVGGLGKTWLRTLDFRAIDALLVVGVVVLASYEYGRIAEAWSAVVVQRPLVFIAKRTSWLQDPDFLANLSISDLQLRLPSIPEAKQGNKWTVYFYASLVSPWLGSDLLKRYAWEKLARNSAFSYAVLWATSIVTGDLGIVMHKLSVGNWGFGTTEYSVLLGVLTIVTYYEYYRRNCWNNDLLVKVLPVLIKAEELVRETKYIQIVPGSGLGGVEWKVLDANGRTIVHGATPRDGV